MDKCYIAHGGRELVIGGKLTILPEATIEGLPGAGVAEYQEQSVATTVAALKEDLNALLAKLQEAGIMASKQPEPDEE